MKLYDSLAEFWPVMSAPDGGGGNNAFHLKVHARLTLVDPADGMLAHSRRINPESEHVVADMRDVRIHDPDPADSSYVADYVFAIRTTVNGELRLEHDSHVEGLFPRQTWLDTLTAAGFDAARAVPLEHSEVEPGVHEVFVATRPVASLARS